MSFRLVYESWDCMDLFCELAESFINGSLPAQVFQGKIILNSVNLCLCNLNWKDVSPNSTMCSVNKQQVFRQERKTAEMVFSTTWYHNKEGMVSWGMSVDPVLGTPHKIPSIACKIPSIASTQDILHRIKHSKKYKLPSPENPLLVSCHYFTSQSNPNMVSIIFLTLKKRTALPEKVGNLPNVTQ